MSIDSFVSGIEDKTNTPLVRDKGDTLAVAAAEIEKIRAQFLAQQLAAIKTIDASRGAANDETFSGPAHIVGASNTPGLRAVLADLFAVDARKTGREMA